MTLLRDPLIHFVLLGAALFAGHAAWSNYVTRADRQLIVDTREIARQADLFTIENSRPPNEAELNGIILAFVEEEVLARDAVAMGLDQDDTVIRRRLAQKMRLLGEEARIAPPSDAVLSEWFEARRDAYITPERRQLVHVFFSDERRADARAAAEAAALSDGLGEDWVSIGDPFIISRNVGPASRLKLQQDYGEAFSDAAFTQEIGVWGPPVRTPFGIHRLRVDAALSRIEPELADVKDRVLRDWTDAARAERAAQDLRNRVARYDVVIED